MLTLIKCIFLIGLIGQGLAESNPLDSKPTNVQVKLLEDDPSRVLVTWDFAGAASSKLQFVVKYKREDDKKSSIKKVSEKSVTLGPLLCGTYSVSVIAEEEGFCSRESDKVSVTLSPVQDSVTGARTRKLSETSFVVEVQDKVKRCSADILVEIYELSAYYFLRGKTAYTKTYWSGTPQTKSFEFNGMTPSQVYKTVISIDYGNGVRSQAILNDVKYWTLESCASPDPIQNMKFSYSGNSMDFTWDANPQSKSYFFTIYDQYFGGLKQVKVNTTSHKILLSELKGCQAYRFGVVGVSPDGITGKITNVLTEYAPYDYSADLGKLVALQDAANSISVRVTGALPACPFQLQASVTEKDASGATLRTYQVQGEVSSRKVVIEGVQAGKKYDITVKRLQQSGTPPTAKIENFEAKASAQGPYAVQGADQIFYSMVYKADGDPLEYYPGFEDPSSGTFASLNGLFCQAVNRVVDRSTEGEYYLVGCQVYGVIPRSVITKTRIMLARFDGKPGTMTQDEMRKILQSGIDNSFADDKMKFFGDDISFVAPTDEEPNVQPTKLTIVGRERHHADIDWELNLPDKYRLDQLEVRVEPADSCTNKVYLIRDLTQTSIRVTELNECHEYIVSLIGQYKGVRSSIRSSVKLTIPNPVEEAKLEMVDIFGNPRGLMVTVNEGKRTCPSLVTQISIDMLEFYEEQYRVIETKVFDPNEKNLVWKWWDALKGYHYFVRVAVRNTTSHGQVSSVTTSEVFTTFDGYLEAPKNLNVTLVNHTVVVVTCDEVGRSWESGPIEYHKVVATDQYGKQYAAYYMQNTKEGKMQAIIPNLPHSRTFKFRAHARSWSWRFSKESRPVSITMPIKYPKIVKVTAVQEDAQSFTTYFSMNDTKIYSRLFYVNQVKVYSPQGALLSSFNVTGTTRRVYTRTPADFNSGNRYEIVPIVLDANSVGTVVDTFTKIVITLKSTWKAQELVTWKFKADVLNSFGLPMEWKPLIYTEPESKEYKQICSEICDNAMRQIDAAGEERSAFNCEMIRLSMSWSTLLAEIKMDLGNWDGTTRSIFGKALMEAGKDIVPNNGTPKLKDWYYNYKYD